MRKNTVITVKSLSQHQDLIIDGSVLNGGCKGISRISELNSTEVRIQGIGLGNLREPADVLNAGNSGTTIRPMLRILASHRVCNFTLTGDSSLRSRPMSPVIQPLVARGAPIWGRDGDKNWHR